MSDISIYQMCINNVAREIRATPPAIHDDDEVPFFNAFTCSTVLAVAFCKTKEDVIADILEASKRKP